MEAIKHILTCIALIGCAAAMVFMAAHGINENNKRDNARYMWIADCVDGGKRAEDCKAIYIKYKEQNQ